jgi:hypothetical protein
MSAMLVLTMIAAAALSPATTSARIPDSAIYLVPVTPDDVRRYSHALIQLAARAGLPPTSVGSDGFDRALAKIGASERDAILADNGLTPAFFARIDAQVRHREPFRIILIEELRLASHVPRG